MSDEVKKDNYSADNIQVLEGLEAVRTRGRTGQCKGLAGGRTWGAGGRKCVGRVDAVGFLTGHFVASV